MIGIGWNGYIARQEDVAYTVEELKEMIEVKD